MNQDRLSEQLKRLPVPDSGQARERTVAQARADVAVRRRARRWRAPVGRAVVAACVIVLSAASLLTPPGQAVARWVGDLVGIGDVGGPPTLTDRNIGFPIRKAVVIASGLAPDGARYETVVDTLRRPHKLVPGEIFRVCQKIEWPHIPDGDAGPGSCGPAFPPPLSGQQPGRAHARTYGGAVVYLDASAWPVLQGFAQPQVARVRVLYEDRAGRRREGRVNLVRLTGRVARRVGSDRPVGYFIAFLGPSFRRVLLGAPRYLRRVDPEAITVIAYDPAGRELGRTHQTNAITTQPPTPSRPHR